MRLFERISEQIVHVTVRRVKEIAEVAADFPVSQVLEQSVEVMKVIRLEQVSERVVEQIVAAPQIQEHVCEVFKVSRLERVSERMEKRSWRWGNSCLWSTGLWTTVED